MEAAFVAAVLALAHRKRIASLFFPCIAAHQAFTFCHGITGALSRIAALRRREPDGPRERATSPGPRNSPT